MPDDDPILLQLVPRPADPVEHDLDGLVRDLAHVLDDLRAVHRALADDPDPHGPREADFDRLRQQRDQLGMQIGMAVVRLVARGGSVHVREPEGPLVAQNNPDPTDSEERAPVPDGIGVEAESVQNDDPVTEPVGDEPLDEALGGADPERAPTLDDPAQVPLPAPAPDRNLRLPDPEPALASQTPRTPAPTSTPPLDLRQLLDAIGRPARVVTSGDAAATLDRLFASTAHLDGWLVYPTEVQRALTGLTSSIARHVQDEVEVDLGRGHDRLLRSWFSTMTHWSKLYQPGFVPGLSRRFGPERESWLADAEHWWWTLVDAATPRPAGGLGEPESNVRPWVPPRPREPEPEPEPAPEPADALREVERAVADPDADLGAAVKLAIDAGFGQRDPRLIRALVPAAPRVAKLPGLKTLKSAVKAALKATPGEPGDEDVTVDDTRSMPDDWPFLALTSGKDVVVIGGDRRPEAAERIREAFRFASMTWEETNKRRVAALVERIRRRTVDVLIVLRDFIGHAEMNPIVDAAKAADVPYAVVDAGYGVAQVRLAIERYLRSRVERCEDSSLSDLRASAVLR